MSDRYDRQLIVTLGTDKVVRDAAWCLLAKGMQSLLPSSICRLPYREGLTDEDVNRLKFETAKLSMNSRLYIIGHGDWQAGKVEDYTSNELATTLGKAALPAVKIISLVSCSTAGSEGVVQTSNKGTHLFYMSSLV